VKNLLDLVLDDSKGPMKQMRAREMKLQQPQNGARLNLKPTLRNKRNKTTDKHRKEKHLQN
jgi:hypothetical protein